jgi:hypothetical protein
MNAKEIIEARGQVQLMQTKLRAFNCHVITRCCHLATQTQNAIDYGERFLTHLHQLEHAILEREVRQRAIALDEAAK